MPAGFLHGVMEMGKNSKKFGAERRAPRIRHFFFAKLFSLCRVGVPRGELAEPWGFPFTSKKKASNVYRDRYGCLPVVQKHINHKKRGSHHNAENCGFAMTFFLFFSAFRLPLYLP
ncbi:MAG: hypothetical protein IJY12_02980 [Clostridia bacterium]|nr:hypothetical protein [Clostridia bacterium]